MHQMICIKHFETHPRAGSETSATNSCYCVITTIPQLASMGLQSNEPSAPPES